MPQSLIRNAPPKPDRETFTRERRAKRRENRQTEKQLKDAAKRRDHRTCRWPNCDCRRDRLPVEAAHLVHKGRGGDPKLLRTTKQSLITLCRPKHRGNVSFDSGDLDIRPLTDHGTDGPCSFWVKDIGGWELVGREQAVGILERLS